jgi:hypothetical protein
VPYYRTYPGLRVPQPILLRPHSCDTPISELASEVLALTKMSWNSTQFDQASPIPIRAARQVGRVLKYVPFGQIEQPDYRLLQLIDDQLIARRVLIMKRAKLIDPLGAGTVVDSYAI